MRGVVVEEEGGRGSGRRGETSRTIWLLVTSKVSLKIADTEQLYQARQTIGGIGNVKMCLCETHVRVVPVHTGTF